MGYCKSGSTAVDHRSIAGKWVRRGLVIREWKCPDDTLLAMMTVAVMLNLSTGKAACCPWIANPPLLRLVQS